jgi:hypothetical protein
MALRRKDISEIDGFGQDKDVKSMSVIHVSCNGRQSKNLIETHVLKNWNSAFKRHNFIESKPPDENPTTGNAMRK